MLPILLAIVTLISIGTADIFTTLNSRRLGGYSASLWVYVWGFSFYCLLIPFHLQEIARLTWPVLLVNVGVALAGVIGYVLFIRALEIGNAAIVGTISSSYIAATVLISTLFLGESIGLYQVLAIAVIMIGIILTGEDTASLRKGIWNKGTLLALGTMVSWGFYYAYVKIPAEAIGPVWTNFINATPFILVFLMMKFRRMPIRMPDTKSAVYLTAGAVLMNIGYMAYSVAIVKGSVAVVAPIAGSAAVLFAVLAHFIFRDAINKRQIAGVVIASLGIAALSVLSV